MKDKAGREIRPGDILVYGKALGRCAGMQYGKVLYVYKSVDKWSDRKKEKLRFVGIDDGWNTKSLQKPSSLEFSERLLIVSREQVNPKALKLLDTIKLEDYPQKP